MGFLNAFVSYGIVLLAFVLAGGLAIFLGISLRKKKNGASKDQEMTEKETASAKTE